MATQGGTKCIKFLVFFFNFLFFVFGIALLGFGIYAEVKVGNYASISSVDYVTGSRLLIAVGVIIATISFFGCCGAWKENRCLLGIFFVLLLILLGLEIAAAVLGYKDRAKIESSIKSDIDKAMDKYKENKLTIDDMQKELKCCGTTGPSSWLSKPQKTAPDSCKCADSSQKCTAGYYSEGCADKLKAFLKDNLLIISALAITLLVIQILGILFIFRDEIFIMSNGGGTKCIKYLVFFFNFLFFVLGIALVGFGAYAEIKFGPYVIFSSTNYATGSRLLIAVGVIISVISFFGCCGAWKENKCMLIIFFVLLFVLLGLEIAAAVLGYKDRDKIEEDIMKDIQNKMKDYPDKYEKEIDDLQKELKCCGASGPGDWLTIAGRLIPPSSCKCEGVSNDKCSTYTLNLYFKAGCAPALKTYVYDKLLVIAALAITLIVIQVLGMVFALILICRIAS